MKHQVLRMTLLAAAVFALLAPLGTAAGPTFVTYGTIEGAVGAYAYSAGAHQYRVYLEAGDRVDASLEWFDALADLDLSIMAPNGSCSILPTTDTDCIIGSAAGRADCNNRGGALLGTSPETASRVATVTGWHTVAVLPGLATGSDVDYILTIDIVGSASTSSIYRDTDSGFVSPSAFCRVLA